METTAPKRQGWLRGWVRAVLAQPTAKIGLAIVVFFILAALAQPILFATVWPRNIYDPRAGFDITTTHPAPISWAHPLGTDGFGKDAPLDAAGRHRALAGGRRHRRLRLRVRCSHSWLRSWPPIGGSVGSSTSLIDGALFVPIPVVMLILGADPRADRLTPAVFGLIFGALTGASSGALVLRSQALPLMRAEYVEAARIVGASRRQLIFRHLIPSSDSAGWRLRRARCRRGDHHPGIPGLACLFRREERLGHADLLGDDASGALQWNIIIAAGVAISLLTLGFFLLATGLRRAAETRPLSTGARKPASRDVRGGSLPPTWRPSPAPRMPAGPCRAPPTRRSTCRPAVAFAESPPSKSPIAWRVLRLNTSPANAPPMMRTAMPIPTNVEPKEKASLESTR